MNFEAVLVSEGEQLGADEAVAGEGAVGVGGIEVVSVE